MDTIYTINKIRAFGSNVFRFNRVNRVNPVYSVLPCGVAARMDTIYTINKIRAFSSSVLSV